MPNPNYSELRLIANYGQDDTRASQDGQGTRVEVAVSTDSDETDHKWVYAAPLAGMYIELAHYNAVKQVSLQNFSAFPGSSFYVDNTTGALIPDFVAAGERITFNDPDVTTGIMVYSIAAQELTDWHLTIIGDKD